MATPLIMTPSSQNLMVPIKKSQKKRKSKSKSKKNKPVELTEPSLSFSGSESLSVTASFDSSMNSLTCSLPSPSSLELVIDHAFDVVEEKNYAITPYSDEISPLSTLSRFDDFPKTDVVTQNTKISEQKFIPESKCDYNSDDMSESESLYSLNSELSTPFEKEESLNSMDKSINSNNLFKIQNKKCTQKPTQNSKEDMLLPIIMDDFTSISMNSTHEMHSNDYDGDNDHDDELPLFDFANFSNGSGGTLCLLTPSVSQCSYGEDSFCKIIAD